MTITDPGKTQYSAFGQCRQSHKMVGTKGVTVLLSCACCSFINGAVCEFDCQALSPAVEITMLA